MNFGFSVTDGTSINFENRAFSGLDNLARITQEVQIDTGGINVENAKFKSALYDTFVFVILQVPIMILIALFTAIVLNREVIGRGFWRAVFFYPVMLSPVVVAFLWTLILKRQGMLSQTLMDWNWISEPIQWLMDPTGLCFGQSLSIHGLIWVFICSSCWLDFSQFQEIFMRLHKWMGLLKGEFFGELHYPY